MRKIFVAFGILVHLIILPSCKEKTQKSVGGASQISAIFEIPKNSKGYTTEQQNILDRIKITTDPTKVIWIHLITLDGKIVRRMPVRCKITIGRNSRRARTCWPLYRRETTLFGSTMPHQKNSTGRLFKHSRINPKRDFMII